MLAAHIYCLHIGSGRRNLPRWHPVDFLPSALLLARAGALPPVPPIVPAVSARGLRLRQVTVLLFTRDTKRSAGFPSSSGFSAKRGMGRLRQTALRRTTASGGLRRPLHAPGGHLQSSDRGYRRRSGEIHLERLPRQQSGEDHDPLGRPIHRAISPARSPKRVPPHSLLRIPCQSSSP